MPSRRPLPAPLGEVFTVRAAADAGVTAGRLRGGDLDRPFHGVRATQASRELADATDPTDATDGPHARQARARRMGARNLAPRLRDDQFFSHESAAALWRAPLPLAWTEDHVPAGPADLPVHVSTFGDGHLIRARGVAAHRARRRTSRFITMDGMRVADAETTWASLGHLPLIDLVALGDHFCRMWRPGYGRPDTGLESISSVTRLQAAIDSGRRTGITRLRQAIELIREDSWSPKESAVRCHLVFAGLPEPLLNHDVYDEYGRFLGCVDLCYPELKIAIEYQSMLHHARYSADVERLAALRAAGWIVIEVTSTLLVDPSILVARVRDAIRSRRR